MTDIERKLKYGWFSGEAKYEDGGYVRHWGIFWKPLWWFDNTGLPQLTYHHPDGYKLRPNNRFKTDFGSVPYILQAIMPGIFSAFRWRKIYPFHDSGYMEAGLWYAEEGCEDFVFKPMSRKQLDDILALGIKAEGGDSIHSAPIWFGVRLGGSKAWHKKDLKKAA